ncbi:MAG: TetR/AcrR family transcriptional regulator [Myxococcales bacterium]|nr:TetR/AcrR family transcriptional regulator [Myxococcales bacterium]
MGRRKTYDREDVTRRAMELFWRHGFDGTSTADLVEHMQINRFSLFAEFGSKQGLFEAALELYEREVVSANLAVLEAEGASLDDIVSFIEGFSGPEDGSASIGCLLCNAAVETAPRQPAVQRAVTAYADRMRRAFRGALAQAQADGIVADGVCLDDEAGSLTMMLVGTFVMARAGVPRGVLEGAVRSAIAHVQGLPKR